ncbi:hypothetical protein [Gemmatimonas sp.]|uniref:hypothetical protein n=1 Tax=Gemmatimonas sp. TaxID=1962908 RepID=UPI003982EC11
MESTATGDAHGIGLFAQKKFGASPFYGQISASLNRTRFTGTDGTARTGAFDSPVTTNAVVGWRPKSRWEVATRLRGASGLPYTPLVNSGALAGTLDFMHYNSRRVETFIATHLRVDRRFIMGRRQLIAFLDLQNFTNRQNQQAPQWDPRMRTVKDNTNIGLLPRLA